MNARLLSFTLAVGVFVVNLTAAEQRSAASSSAVDAKQPSRDAAQAVAKPQDLWGFLPPAVARINGKDIPKQEFIAAMENQMKGPDGKIPPMITSELLQRAAPRQVKSYVDQRLLLPVAAKAGFVPSSDLVAGVLKEQLNSMPKEQREMVKMQLQMTGKDENSYIAELSKNTAVQEGVAIERYLDKTVFSKITVTDEDARKFYESNIERFKEPADPADSIRASHILISVPDKATKEQDSAAKAKAESILADLKKNKNGFEAAAKSSSDCPSKDNGGSLGLFTKGQMVKEFEDAAFALKEGELSGVVKTKFGYHIIRRDAAQKERTTSYDEVKNRLKDGIKLQKAQEEIERIVTELEKENKVEFLVKDQVSDAPAK